MFGLSVLIMIILVSDISNRFTTFVIRWLVLADSELKILGYYSIFNVLTVLESDGKVFGL